MKAILILILAALACSCAEKPLVAVPIVKQREVPVEQDATPAVNQAKDSAAQADVASEAARVHVEQAGKIFSELQASLQEAMGESDRLRKQGAASQEELTALWQKLVASFAQNKTLGEDLAAAQQANVRERFLRQVAAADLNVARDLIQKKDHEVKQVRMQFADEVQSNHLNGQALVNATARAEKNEARANKAEGKNAIYDKVALGIGVLIVLFFLIQWLRPKF